MNRKWKDIKDFEELYQVSDDGLIISKKTHTQAAMRDNLYSTNKAVSINQYSKQGTYIATYNSAGDACRSIGKIGCSSHISATCRGERQTAYGYIWKYA